MHNDKIVNLVGPWQQNKTSDKINTMACGRIKSYLWGVDEI